MKISIVLGTRPEIIKMSSIIKECEKVKLDYFILHTGQHYSHDMDKAFFQQLGLPEAKYNLGIGSGSHGEQTGKMLMGVEKILQEEKPDIVLVEGDTNTVLAGALAASKLGIRVGHVEAGLRSFDKMMPEEINRILTDHCSDFLFAPTPRAKQNLLREGIDQEMIFITGNTIVDAVHLYSKLLKDTDFIHQSDLRYKNYFLVTIHRQENVDNIEKFTRILQSLEKVEKEFHLPLIYPLHPRSRKKMKEFKVKPRGIRLIGPIDFLSFLRLEAGAKLVLTDSGGVQEEACILGVPCVTLRDSTERPETLDVSRIYRFSLPALTMSVCLAVMTNVDLIFVKH
ncbi:MAG: UDP-N-acetylglucosamine 2-epimerase (non-hydrolyzing), partial [Firmicutes bacterium]|nr:UDP-N-acetylglucosamine 2-epimerase (non-hydrolyzing) [Bacillota bacterium]